MLIKFGADVNMLNLDDQSPLNVAEADGEFCICKLLVKKRKEMRTIYKKALHVFAKQDDLDMFKIHLYKGENVNERDEKMRTPLHVAMIFGSDEMCNLLLKYGADVHAKDSNMDNSIQLAFYYGRFKLREKILYNISYIG